MTRLVDNVIDEIVRRESSEYTNHPADRGGPTKYGVTLATLRSVWGSQCTEDDVRNLTEADARGIYSAVYAAPFSRFIGHAALFALCVDSAVQHGVPRVQGWLHAIPSSDPDVNYAGLLKRRIEFYGEIITANPSQAVFAKGWLRRVAEFAR